MNTETQHSDPDLPQQFIDQLLDILLAHPEDITVSAKFNQISQAAQLLCNH